MGTSQVAGSMKSVRGNKHGWVECLGDHNGCPFGLPSKPPHNGNSTSKGIFGVSMTLQKWLVITLNHGFINPLLIRASPGTLNTGIVLCASLQKVHCNDLCDGPSHRSQRIVPALSWCIPAARKPMTSECQIGLKAALNWENPVI